MIYHHFVSDYRTIPFKSEYTGLCSRTTRTGMAIKHTARQTNPMTQLYALGSAFILMNYFHFLMDWIGVFLKAPF